MVDAATGGRSVFARGIEKVYLGVPQGPLEFVNFDSVDITRIDDEQISAAITGNDGRDRGTPSDVKFTDKLKYAMTPSRILFDLVAAFGKPKSSDALAGKTFKIDTPGGNAGGTLYVEGDQLVFTGGSGSGARAHVSAVDGGTGAVTGIVVDDPGFGYASGDTVSFTITSAAGTGATGGTASLKAGAWLVKIRPSRTNEIRAASLYLFEGGAYTATLQSGRRCADIQITDAANKRAEVDITYSDPTGDTISGFAIVKDGDGFTGTASSRGRRPYDSNLSDGKSLYVKVTAVTADKVTCKAKYDVLEADPTAFATAAGAYDTATFDVPIVGTDSTGIDHDGYGAVVKDEGVVGLFGENFEQFEITFGGDFTGIDTDDEFQFPAVCDALTKSVNIESRLSAFHLIRKLGDGSELRIDKGSLKITRPYKAYRANGRRIPQAIDPMGDVMGTWSFSKRLFDRYFRQRSDEHARFSIHDKYAIENGFESVEVYAGQVAVYGMKSGAIASKNVLEETITLESEQPETAGSPPAGFEGTYPIEFNVTTRVDPTWLS
jgi:hypothetical protein